VKDVSIDFGSSIMTSCGYKHWYSLSPGVLLAGGGKECLKYLTMKSRVIRYSVILLVRYFVSTGFINNRVIAGYNLSVIGISMHCKIS